MANRFTEAIADIGTGPPKKEVPTENVTVVDVDITFSRWVDIFVKTYFAALVAGIVVLVILGLPILFIYLAYSN